MAQINAIDLPNAEVEDEWTSEDTGHHLVRITTTEDNMELSYIIGQFQDRGYAVNGVDFKRNAISFSK